METTEVEGIGLGKGRRSPSPLWGFEGYKKQSSSILDYERWAWS